MRPKRITVTDAATSNPIPLDHRAPRFDVSLFVDILSGTPTYTVQVTGDDVQADGYNATTGNWQDHSYLASLTASDKGNLDFPATAVRITQTGTGVSQLTILHNGTR